MKFWSPRHWAQRRPANDLERLERMLRYADIIVTARDGRRLVGISRAVTDFAYCCYLSDLAVDLAYQRQGIGQNLINSRAPFSLLNPDAEIPMFCVPSGGDREFRDGSEIRGIRGKIAKGVGKTAVAGEFRPQRGLTKGC